MNNLEIKRMVYKKAYKIINSLKRKVGKDFQSKSNSILVGSHNYPNVNAGVLSYVTKPSERSGVMEVLLERAKVVDSAKKVLVRNPIDFDEIVLSERPVDVEIFLRKEPTFSLNLSKFTRPILISAKLEKFKVVENPKIKQSVEKIINDEMKSTDAIIELSKHTSVEKISEILSAGLMGKKKKMVPTRWSITATDDILSKHNIDKIKSYDEIDEFYMFHRVFFDNEFLIMLYPSQWGFEMVESWGAEPSVDYEFYHGRKKYASSIEGAYYAARLSVTNYLMKIKRQAACSVFRLVHKGYFAPLGVWVIRDGVKKSFEQKMKFPSLNQMKSFVIEHYRAFEPFFDKSRMARYISQRKLIDF